MFYHGTTTNANIDYKLLPPCESGTLSEEGRKKNLDKIFFTTSLNYAKVYAGRAVARFGGEPVILRVIPPVNETELFSDTVGCDIHIAPHAFCERIL